MSGKYRKYAFGIIWQAELRRRVLTALWIMFCNVHRPAAVAS